jgi:serine protease Do
MNAVVLGRKAGLFLVGIALLSLVGFIAAGATSAPTDHAADPGSSYAQSLSHAFREAAEEILPAVVMIKNTPTLAENSGDRENEPNGELDQIPFGDLPGSPFGDLFQNPEFRRFFRDLPSMPKFGTPRYGVQGMGSGVIIDTSGLILTNDHVVAGGGKITVRLQDGREFEAVDVKHDPKTDLAVVRIEGASPLHAAKVGNSDELKIGDWVLALGQPFGLEGSVTAGIVSGKGRGLGIAPRENFIQTDAAINPGNSGGPLVNLEGEVVGINTAISSRTGGYQGVGFAIPINLANWVARQLADSGTVKRAYLGVVIQPVTQPLAQQFGVKVHEGVVVSEVMDGTPAAKAGVKPGDVIIEFDGKAVSSPSELQGLVEQARIGAKQAMVVMRDGKRVTLDVTAAEQPADYGLAGRGGPGHGESSQFDKLGMEVETLTADVAKQLDVQAEEGVVITNVRPGSPAEMAGLTTGMVITQANRMPVKSVDAFRKALEKQPLEKGLLLLVQSPEGTRFVVIQLEG